MYQLQLQIEKLKQIIEHVINITGNYYSKRLACYSAT